VSEPKLKRVPDPQQTLRPHYTQVNILFPSEQVELPSADKFKAFPPEAQKAILVAFEREQIERHRWLANQQTNEHALNMQSERHFFVWKMAGLIGGVVLALGVLGSGAWLVAHGASTIGTATIIAAVAGLVGTAIYGHKANTAPKEKDRLPNGDSRANEQK
jgi:hypothetical protein